MAFKKTPPALSGRPVKTKKVPRLIPMSTRRPVVKKNVAGPSGPLTVPLSSLLRPSVPTPGGR